MEAGIGTGHGSAPRPRKSVARLLWALFALFVVYGTTIPFSFDLHGRSWADIAARVNWSPLGDIRGDKSLPDIVQNILLFIPFGFLGYLSVVEKRSPLKLAAVVALGSGLSFSVEVLQVFSKTRFPSVSDLVFNTLGAGCGLLLGMAVKRSVLGLKTHERFRRVVDAESAYPALVFLAVAAAGCWVPFDFALDVGAAWEKVKPFLDGRALALSMPDDDFVTFIHFLLAALFLSRLAQESGLPRPALAAVAFAAALGVSLEASQVILGSRVPELQDALVAVLGAGAGGIAFLLPRFHQRPVLWSLAGTAAVFLAAALRGLSPFRFAALHARINWIPFLPQYENTTFATVGNSFENAMVYFPLGFLLAYLFRGRREAALAGPSLAASMAILIEAGQCFIPGRRPDVTDALGAALGAWAGVLVLTRGWRAFKGYMEWDETGHA